MSTRVRGISIAICVLMSVGVCGFASADIIIDDFEAGPTTLTPASTGTTYYSSQTSLPTSHVVGGVRHMDMYASTLPSSINIAGGVLNMNSHYYGGSYFNMIYNGNPAGPGHAAILNLNLTGYEKFQITFSRLDIGMSFRIRVFSGTTNRSAYLPASVGVVEASLASFGSINWADIDCIRIEIGPSQRNFGNVNYTQSISDFRIIGVPEPATISLFLTAGCLLLRRYGRRK